MMSHWSQVFRFVELARHYYWQFRVLPSLLKTFSGVWGWRGRRRIKESHASQKKKLNV
jgi:hypothetical protein